MSGGAAAANFVSFFLREVDYSLTSLTFNRHDGVHYMAGLADCDLVSELADSMSSVRATIAEAEAEV